MSKISAKGIVDRLTGDSYVSRQNAGDVSLYLNLGGSRTPLDQDDFKGMVLLSPRGFVFGACPPEVRKLRDDAMTKEENRWQRRPDVRGPSEDQRVPVFFDGHDASNARCFVKIGSHEVTVNGIFENIEEREGGYDWNEIETFLERLRNHCS